MSIRYGGERVRRGLVHFALGKAVSATCGFVAMILVVRALSVAQFADYSVLVALIEVVTAISGFGLSHALMRYVPELFARNFTQALRQFVLGAVLFRSSVLLLIVAIAYATSAESVPLLGLSDSLGAYRVYLWVVVFRIVSHFLSQILESTLHQGIAQIGFSVASLLRLAGMAYLTQAGNVDLVDVLWVEAASDLACMLIMLGGVLRIVWREPRSAEPVEGKEWITGHMRQIIRFSLAAYAQHLIGLPFGGNTNRLVGGNLFSSAVMANFGFAHSLYEYIKRYLPAQLLVGLVRPVVVARYTEHRNFEAAARTCQGFALINVSLIAALLSALVVGGLETLSWVSAGKYGLDALLLLAALLLVLALETQRLILEMLAQTVERYGFLVPSNLLLSCSVIPAVFAFPYLGAISFPLINGVALLISNLWVRGMLAREGHVFPRQWLPTVKLGLLMLTLTAVGKGTVMLGIHWGIALLISQLLFFAGAWRLCGDELRHFLADLLGRRFSETREVI